MQYYFHYPERQISNPRFRYTEYETAEMIDFYGAVQMISVGFSEENIRKNTDEFLLYSPIEFISQVYFSDSIWGRLHILF